MLDGCENMQYVNERGSVLTVEAAAVGHILERREKILDELGRDTRCVSGSAIVQQQRLILRIFQVALYLLQEGAELFPVR